MFLFSLVYISPILETLWHRTPMWTSNYSERHKGMLGSFIRKYKHGHIQNVKTIKNKKDQEECKKQ